MFFFASEIVVYVYAHETLSSCVIFDYVLFAWSESPRGNSVDKVKYGRKNTVATHWIHIHSKPGSETPIGYHSWAYTNHNLLKYFS
jgi:hypothetical protein